MSSVADRVATRGAIRAILALQRADGAIPWFEDGPWDPWNHAECLMALAVAAEWEAMRAGLDQLAGCQLADGSWLAGYGNALPMADRVRIARTPPPQVRDTNFAAYPATALHHAWLTTRDLSLVHRHWPMIRSAIGFVLSCQHEAGDIGWSAEARGTAADDAVLAGNASIFHSLGHAIALATLVGDPQSAWLPARARLGAAIRCRPDRFDRCGTDRSGFAMDAYYPVLAGALPPDEGRARLRFAGRRFLVDGLGCRCVAGEPWVTVAESAELAMTLAGLGLRRQAATLLDWQDARQDADGAYWMGWQFEERIVWPEEKPGWTQAAMILAREALVPGSATTRIMLFNGR